MDLNSVPQRRIKAKMHMGSIYVVSIAVAVAFKMMQG